MNIKENNESFSNLMMNLKKEIEKTLNNSISSKEIEELRHGYEGKYNKERFKEYLVKKTALHIVFKYIFIRMMSESQKLISPKFNSEAISNWNEMSKNYRKDYLMLFKIANEDFRRNEQTNYLFEPCIYDSYIDKLYIFNNNDNIIYKLKDYDLKTLDPNVAASLFDFLYPSEDRVILQGFLDESKLITYLLQSLGLI